MINYIQIGENGEILSSGTAGVASLDVLRELNAGGQFIQTPEPISNPGAMLWDGQQVIEKPARPSVAHEFNYDTKTWVLNADLAWQQVRQQRDVLIAQVDWTTLPDVPFSPEQRAAWQAYRQALRDITDQPDPCAIEWPQMPE